MKAAFGSTLPFKDGICDNALKGAIAEFQKVWGVTPDSTIDLHGQTLKRLNRLANPLVLKLITMHHVAKGGYVIAFATCDAGPLPPAGTGYAQLLCFPDEKNSIDVSDRPAHNLLSEDNLGDVLKIFEKLGCWAAPVQCRIQLRYKGAAISTSDAQTLIAPIQPHNGIMLPLDEANNGPKLTYQGDPDAKDFHGRMFAQVAGYDKCVFVWAGNFETKNEFRGFDCITYVGTTCGGSNMHMADSNDLANSLGASKVELTRKATQVKVQLEQADPAEVKEFFSGTLTGYFLIFSAGHIVLVADGMVYEFKGSTPSGYTCSTVADWLKPYKTMKLTVRKLSNKPARAV